MDFSVIIPCFNAAETIGTQLEALLGQCPTYQWEIIVSDNGSSDGTAAVLKRYRERLPNLCVVDASDRRGPSHARNVGARAATGELLLFCDADDEVGPGWIAAMTQALSKYDFVASCLDTERLSSPRALAIMGNWRQRDGLIVYKYVPFLPYGDTSGLGVKRAVHEAVGGFDEDLMACEDCDYCWRIQLAGTILHFVPDALLYSRHKDPRSGAYRQAWCWGQYHALLIKKFRTLGMPKAPLSIGLKLWWRLLRHPPIFRSQQHRDRWTWNLCYRFGQMIGCIKHRILAL